jgi:tight adherence protein B
MIFLILASVFATAAVAIVFLFEPIRQALLRNVFRQQDHVARELAQMFIFISLTGLQRLKWTLAIAASGMTLLLTWEATPPGPLVASGLIMCVAYWSPELVILMMRRRRRIAFSNQLVDGLVLMSNGLRSGFTLLQAIDMVIDEMPAPISQEFQLAREEMRVGVDLDQALQNCVERTKDQDFDLVVAAVKITRQLGGNLPEVFDRIVAMVRDRKNMAGKAEALTAEGRLQAVVVGLLPYVFGFFLVKVNPDMMSLMWRTVPGFLGLVLAIILDVVGYLWVLKLTRIKY